MARKEGTLVLGSNLEIKAAAPADARLVVEKKADLLTYEYPYSGMIVSVTNDSTDNGAYQLVGSDASLAESWSKIGSGDAGHVELTQARYDALTPEEKNNGTVYFITDAAANDYHHYTTTERQIGTFYGHPLYERIIDASFTLVPEDDKTVLTNLPSRYTLINVFGVIYERNNPEKRYFVPNSSVSVRYNDPDGDFWTIRFGDCPDNTLIIMRLVYQYIKRTF